MNPHFHDNDPSPRSIRRPRSRTRRLVGLIALALSVTAVAAACSSDDDSKSDDATTTVAEASGSDGGDADADGATEEYCSLAKEINEQQGAPTPEQLEQYKELAPPAIAEEAATVTAAFAAAGENVGAVFADPDASAALEKITAFEAEECDLGEVSTQDASVTELDPEATRIDVTAKDYHFDTTYPTAAGKYSFAINNVGEQPHIAILAKLEDGATIEGAMESGGEEGIAETYESDPLPPGAEGFLTAELTPGNWVLICPIPDPEGVPHSEHGMVHEFTIS